MKNKNKIDKIIFYGHNNNMANGKWLMRFEFIREIVHEEV